MLILPGESQLDRIPLVFTPKGDNPKGPAGTVTDYFGTQYNFVHRIKFAATIILILR